MVLLTRQPDIRVREAVLSTLEKFLVRKNFKRMFLFCNGILVACKSVHEDDVHSIEWIRNAFVPTEGRTRICIHC